MPASYVYTTVLIGCIVGAAHLSVCSVYKFQTLKQNGLVIPKYWHERFPGQLGVSSVLTSSSQSWKVMRTAA